MPFLSMYGFPSMPLTALSICIILYLGVGIPLGCILVVLDLSGSVLLLFFIPSVDISGIRYGENEYHITIKPQDYRNKNRASGVPVRRRTLCNCACRLCTLIMCSEPLLTAHYHLRNYYITKYKRSNPHHGLLIKIKKSSQLSAAWHRCAYPCLGAFFPGLGVHMIIKQDGKYFSTKRLEK